MIVIDCQQGTEEWLKARLGLITGSHMSEIITPGGKASTQVTSYLYKLAAETVTGEPGKFYESEDMRTGTEREPEAREFYSFLRDVEIQQVGFVRHNALLCGVSPDGWIGDDAMAEFKCPADHTQVKRLAEGVLPTTYFPQIQANLWICERDWCDFVSYHPKMKPLIVRVHRNEKYIKTMASLVESASSVLQQLIEKVKK